MSEIHAGGSNRLGSFHRFEESTEDRLGGKTAVWRLGTCLPVFQPGHSWRNENHFTCGSGRSLFPDVPVLVDRVLNGWFLKSGAWLLPSPTRHGAMASPPWSSAPLSLRRWLLARSRRSGAPRRGPICATRNRCRRVFSRNRLDAPTSSKLLDKVSRHRKGTSDKLVGMGCPGQQLRLFQSSCKALESHRVPEDNFHYIFHYILFLGPPFPPQTSGKAGLPAKYCSGQAMDKPWDSDKVPGWCRSVGWNANLER